MNSYPSLQPCGDRAGVLQILDQNIIVCGAYLVLLHQVIDGRLARQYKEAGECNRVKNVVIQTCEGSIWLLNIYSCNSLPLVMSFDVKVNL